MAKCVFLKIELQKPTLNRVNNALTTLWWAAFRGRRSTMGCNSIRKYTTFGRMEWNWRRISDSMVHDFNGVASALVCGERRNQSMLIRCCIKFIVTNQTRFLIFFNFLMQRSLVQALYANEIFFHSHLVSLILLHRLKITPV